MSSTRIVANITCQQFSSNLYTQYITQWLDASKTINHWRVTKAILYKISARQQAKFVDAVNQTKNTAHTHTVV